MSSIIVSPSATGAGSVTLAAPVTASALTQELPASSGTVALTSDVIGVGQTWQVVTRVSGTTYTNTTGKPIMLSFAANNTSGTTVLVDGVTVISVASSAYIFVVTLIIPAGATYRATSAYSGLITPRELR